LREIFGSKRDKVTGEWRTLHNEELNDLYCSPNIVWVINPLNTKLNSMCHLLVLLGAHLILHISRIRVKLTMRWAGHVARMGYRRCLYRVLVGKPERKRPLGRPRHRWEDNMKMDLQEVRCGGMDWIKLALDRDRWRAHTNAVMKLWVT